MQPPGFDPSEIPFSSRRLRSQNCSSKQRATNLYRESHRDDQRPQRQRPSASSSHQRVSGRPVKNSTWSIRSYLLLTILIRPPCAALPFTLEIVKFRLSPSAEKQAHQKQLDYYNRIMALFEAQHEYTECVTTAVDTVLHVAEPEINSLAIARY